MAKATNRLRAGIGGFTLVEMLLVLAILALLLGLLSPAILKAFEAASDNSQKGEEARLKSAIVEYWHDQGRWPVPSGVKPEKARHYKVGYTNDNFKVFDLLLDVPYAGATKSYIHPNEHMTPVKATGSFPTPEATRLKYIIEGNPKDNITPRSNDRTLVYWHKKSKGYKPYCVTIDLRNNQVQVTAP